ncbi:sigma factor [Aquisalimonas sp.]|uniref:sigma factor n=1 Tax=Aquisalimonas sp. TaxID=1872621 RepID=UPI003452410B
MHRLARSLLANPDEADDLVQEWLDRALSRASRWDSNKGTRSWPFSILVFRRRFRVYCSAPMNRSVYRRPVPW